MLYLLVEVLLSYTSVLSSCDGKRQFICWKQVRFISTRLYHLCLNMLRLGAFFTSSDINSYLAVCKFEPSRPKPNILETGRGTDPLSPNLEPCSTGPWGFSYHHIKKKKKGLLCTANHFHHLHGLLYHYYSELVHADNGIIHWLTSNFAQAVLSVEIFIW